MQIQRHPMPMPLQFSAMKPPTKINHDRIQFGASYPTQFSVSEKPLALTTSEVLIVPRYLTPQLSRQTSMKDYEEQFLKSDDLKKLDEAMHLAIRQAVTYNGFNGSAGQVQVIDRPGLMYRGIGEENAPVSSPQKVVLVGLGEKEKITPQKIESTIASALKNPAVSKSEHLAFYLPEPQPRFHQGATVEALVQGVNKATYQSAEAVKPRPEFKRVELILPTGQTTLHPVIHNYHGEALPKDKGMPFTLAPATQFITQGQAIADALGYAKDLANSPYNKLDARTLVAKAKTLKKDLGPQVSIKTASTDWIKTNMPAFYSVAKGSAYSDPPQFIKMTYKPTGEIKKKIAVIGKSVMYDVGGVQDKGDGMNNMSKDMTGGAYALGLMKALGTLKPEGVEVTVYLAATPNLNNADKAYKPDDILDSAVGKKIRLNHTDAEGRLTLIDAVYQAVQDSKPDEIITMATLTGHAMNSVGKRVALLTTEADEEFSNRLMRIAKQLGEGFQPLAVDDEDFANIQSDDDATHLSNTGKGSGRGCQKAAAFVMSGKPDAQKDIPLAHWDIAGVMAEGPGWLGESTGIGLKTLIHYVLSQGN